MSTPEEISTGTQIGDAMVTEHVRAAGTRGSKRPMFVSAAVVEELDLTIAAQERIIADLRQMVAIAERTIAILRKACETSIAIFAEMHGPEKTQAIRASVEAALADQDRKGNLQGQVSK